MVMGQKWTRVLLFSEKPLDTNMVLCCTEKLCGGTDTAPQGAHPLYRLSTASKQKIYQSKKRKIIGQTTAVAGRSGRAASGLLPTRLARRAGPAGAIGRTLCSAQRRQGRRGL